MIHLTIYKVSIADGATVMLDGVNINGVNSIDDAAPTKRYAKVE